MLLFLTMLIAISGILYELLIGTLSSYLIGDSIQQFSFTIGFFMTGMGIGAYMSRFLEKKAIENFLKVELFLCIIGASSVIFLKYSYILLHTHSGTFQVFYFFITALIGALVGTEIPLVAKIYKELKLKSTSIISDLFTFDYIGALFASLLFPLFLLPVLGLYNISIFVGWLNLFVAIIYIRYIKTFKKSLKKYYIFVGLCAIFLTALMIFSNKIEQFYLNFYYKEPILQTYQSDYQDIVLTKKGEDFRMYLNGNLQFLSLDEQRYHEALIDWPMKILQEKDSIDTLMLGGGDGLGVRNILQYENIGNVDLVELDKKVIEVSSTEKNMLELNKKSLLHPQVNIITQDAFQYLLENNEKKYDFIIADFPDPRDTHTSKLYSQEFYILASQNLKPGGIFVTQASSAFFSTESFWSIEKTLSHVFGNALPYHRYVPSFGDWGFVMSQKGGLTDTNICENLGCTTFDQEYRENYEEIKINSLANPKIIEYYGKGYKKFNL